MTIVQLWWRNEDGNCNSDPPTVPIIIKDIVYELDTDAKTKDVLINYVDKYVYDM